MSAITEKVTLMNATKSVLPSASVVAPSTDSASAAVRVTIDLGTVAEAPKEAPVATKKAPAAKKATTEPKKKTEEKKEEAKPASASSSSSSSTDKQDGSKPTKGAKRKVKEMSEEEKKKHQMEKSSKEFQELLSIRAKLHEAAKMSGAIYTRLSKLPNTFEVNSANVPVRQLDGEHQGVRWYTTMDNGSHRWAVKLLDVTDAKRYENLGADFKSFYTMGPLKHWSKVLIEELITDYQHAAVFFVGVETDGTTSLFMDLWILRSYLKSNYWTGGAVPDNNYFYNRDYKEEVGITITEAHEKARPVMKAATDEAECERANKRQKKDQTTQVSKQEVARCLKKDICPVCKLDTKDDKGEPVGEHDACLYEIVDESPSKPVKTSVFPSASSSSSSSTSPVAAVSDD